MSGSPVRLRWLSPRDIGAQPVRNRRTVTTSGGRRTSVPRRTQPRPPPTASSSTPGPGPCPGEAEAIREPACDDVVLAAQVAIDSLRRSEIAFKALGEAEARRTVNQAQFQQAGLHAPTHCTALLTAAIAATGVVVVLALAARRQDTGDPPPRTPHGAAGRIRRTACTGCRSGCATPGPRPCPPTHARGRRAAIGVVGA
ncbi:DUF6192 family protein [Streptomyces europaeiscabiei]|uniref:DUF6192 family protein n=1 Tax=Streptomyces europaeiscabiei TaxID=146819 RepID=UPI0038D48320